MQLEHLTLQLRPRGPWEALDLGAALLRANWKAVLGAWLALCLPIVVLIYALGPAPSNWLWLVVWWLKPLFDRVPLYVLGRAVFGETPRLHEVIRAVPSLLRTGLFASLTYLRFDPWRSFNLPVRVLEGLRGRAAGERGTVLRKRAGGYAFWLTFVCFIFWIVFEFALIGLVNMFMPDSSGNGENEREFFRTLFRNDQQIPLWAHYLGALADFIALTVVELLYVASGFTLYLNRRVQLEGWDIEVALRALAARVAAIGEKLPWAVAGSLILTIVLTCGSIQTLAADTHSQQIIKEVLAKPEFDQYEEVTHWKYVGPDLKTNKPKDAEPRFSPDADWIIVLGKILRALVWVVLAGLVVALLWRMSRWQAQHSDADALPKAAPTPRQGKVKMEEPLPHDVVAAVQTLLTAGKVRDALGLMYRATAHQLGARASDTEADCLRRARGQDQALRAYVGTLVREWQRAAYAHEVSADSAQALLREWPAYFMRPAQPAAVIK